MFKKVFAGLVLICAVGMPSIHAQTYRVTDKQLHTTPVEDTQKLNKEEKTFSRWEGALGPVMTLGNIMDEDNLLVAKTGYGLNFSVFYYVTSMMAFGIDASYITTSLKANWIDDMRQLRVFAGGKIVLTPHTQPKLYIPYGVGWLQTKVNVPKRDVATTNSAAGYVGLGVEYNFFSHLVAAIDYRLFYLTEPDFGFHLTQHNSVRHDFMLKLTWQI